MHQHYLEYESNCQKCTIKIVVVPNTVNVRKLLKFEDQEKTFQ